MSEFPSIVPSTVFGKSAPSNRIQVGIIGCGRNAIGHDIPQLARFGQARIIAVCDVDSDRADACSEIIRENYVAATQENGGLRGNWEIAVYYDYREMLLNKEVDAVVISLPDHQHAVVCVHAVQAGKHVYLQKPATLTIEEGKILRDAVLATGKIVQLGSQQRSLDPWPQFKRAAELVRNGRIGQLQQIEIGLPVDPAGGNRIIQPIPAGLNYDAWLGTTPEVPFMEDRVHNRSKGRDTIHNRPGWLRCEQFGGGMITNWGSHHIDIAHWAMDMEYSGPIEIWGKALFPQTDKKYDGLWDVHGKCRTEALYANGVHMIISSESPNGIRFIGTDGWIWVARGAYNLNQGLPIIGRNGIYPLYASNPSLLSSVIAAHEVQLYESPEQHLNWLECIQTEQQPIAPIEVGHRTCSTCLLHWMAMKLEKKIYWDPGRETFSKPNPEATALLSRSRRKAYDF